MIGLRLAAVAALSLVALASHAAAPPPPYRMAEGWAHPPAGFVWGEIVDVDVDAQGAVYVLQRCSKDTCVGRTEAPLLKFDALGRHVWSWGSGQLVWPHGIDVAKDGSIWIADGMADAGRGQQVIKLSPTGAELMRIGTAGVSGLGPYTFNGVCDVVVADNGDVFVADGHVNNRIVKYSADGKYLKEWGRAGTAIGEFNMPHSIGMDSKGRVFVADRDNFRIQIFDQDGAFIHEWRQYGRVSGMAIDPKDSLYTVSQNTDVNPTMLRGLYIGSAVDGHVREIVAGFNSEAVAADGAGRIFSGERPRNGSPQEGQPDKLQMFVRGAPPAPR